MNILRLVAEELKDPLRDYKKFDHSKRARWDIKGILGMHSRYVRQLRIGQRIERDHKPEP